MTPVNHDKVQSRAVGIETDRRARMQIGPIFHELAVLHDDVVAAAYKLMDVDITRAVVQREFETDVQHITHVHPRGLVGITALQPQDSLAIGDGC